MTYVKKFAEMMEHLHSTCYVRRLRKNETGKPQYVKTTLLSYRNSNFGNLCEVDLPAPNEDGQRYPHGKEVVDCSRIFWELPKGGELVDKL